MSISASSPYRTSPEIASAVTVPSSAVTASTFTASTMPTMDMISSMKGQVLNEPAYVSYAAASGKTSVAL